MNINCYEMCAYHLRSRNSLTHIIWVIINQNKILLKELNWKKFLNYNHSLSFFSFLSSISCSSFALSLHLSLFRSFYQSLHLLYLVWSRKRQEARVFIYYIVWPIFFFFSIYSLSISPSRTCACTRSIFVHTFCNVIRSKL